MNSITFEYATRSRTYENVSGEQIAQWLRNCEINRKFGSWFMVGIVINGRHIPVYNDIIPAVVWSCIKY